MRSRKKILTIAIITVASVIVAGLTVQIPKLMGQLTDAFLHNKQVEYFFMILLVFLVVTKVLALMSEYLPMILITCNCCFPRLCPLVFSK